VILRPIRDLVVAHRRLVTPRHRQLGFFLPMPFPNPTYKIDAADFDGTNDYMRRVGGLTGAADSKSGIFSVWVRFDSIPALGRIFCGNTTLGGGSATNQVRSAITGSGGAVQFLAADAGGTVATLQLPSATTFTAGATWHHLLWAWDVAVPMRQFYLDGVSDISGEASTNTTLDFTSADWGIAANCDGSSKSSICLADLYFAPGQVLDISVAANLRKFISATGKPVNVGADGSVPTGTAPIVFLHLDKGAAASAFATNRGTGGDFTITGSLDIASTSPSD